MADSVGVISLDLVIKDQIGKQLEGIRQAVRAPADKVGEAIAEAVQKPVQNVSAGIDKAVSGAVAKTEGRVENSLKSTADRIASRNGEIMIHWGEQVAEQCEKASEAVERAASKPVKPQVRIDSGNVERAVQKVNSQVNETAQNARERLEEAGKFEVSGKPMERLAQQIELAYEKLDIMQKKWQELSSVADPTEKQQSQLNVLENQIISATASLGKLENKYSELANGGSKAFSMLKTAASKSFAFIRKTGQTAFSALRRTGSTALNGLKKKFGSVGKTADSMAKPVEKLGRTIRNTFRRVFITATLFAAVRALKSAFADIMKQNTELSDSLNQVRANLAAAFMPIMQAVMPALNAFMSGLAAVTKQVAGFISELFGTTYAQAANAAKRLKDTAKTAQDTAKKVRTAMAGIDEMNVLSAGDSSLKDEEKQSGIDWDKADMSEPKLPNWAEQLKNSIKSGDWKGTGEILADCVNSVFDRVDWNSISTKLNAKISGVCDLVNGFVGRIDWNALGSFFAGGFNTVTSAINTFFDGIDWEALGIGLGTGLNSAVAGVDWTSAGQALVAKLNAVIDTAYGFVTTFDFTAFGSAVGTGLNAAFRKLKLKKAGALIGKALTGAFRFVHGVVKKFDWSGFGNDAADSINAVFDNIDFAEAAQTLSDSIKGILDFLIAAVANINWQKIGEKIYEFLANIDWSGIASRLFTLIGTVLGAAGSLLWGFIKNIVKQIQEYFEEEFSRMDTGNIGVDIVLGILTGIGDALIGIGKWIYTNVFKPFIDGFKKAFDIHSPSKVMAEMGGYIIDGLFNAIRDGIKAVRRIFEDMRDAIHEVFEKIDKWFEKKFGDAWKKIKAVFSGIGMWFRLRWEDVKDVFSPADGWFSEKFSAAWENVTKAFSNCRQFFRNRWEDITGIFGGIGDWFGDRWSDVKNRLSDVKNWFRDKFQQAYNSVTEVFGGLGSFFGGVWEDVSNRARDGMNWFMGRIEDSLNRAIDFLNSWGFELPNGDWFGLAINYVNLPRLAKGGLATAPTLAMVGDNRNAGIDPEVIAPLSKLQGMIGSDPEIAELLRAILALLEKGMSIEIINYMFRNSREFSREVINAVADNEARKGK